MEDRGVCECHDVYYAVDNGDYQAARREVPECSVLEVGGVDATCRVSECYGNEVSVAEPILFEDIIDYNVTAPLFGAVETGVIKQSPGELWLHVRDEWHKEEVLKDINEAIARQLRERRAVVFQRDTKEAALWEAIGTGWENDGYRVNHDFIDDNTAIVRVCWPEVDNEVHVNEVMAGEAAEGSGGNFRGAKAIRFPAGVPNHIASGLRRLHQNLSHPSTSDLVRSEARRGQDPAHWRQAASRERSAAALHLDNAGLGSSPFPFDGTGSLATCYPGRGSTASETWRKEVPLVQTQPARQRPTRLLPLMPSS